MATITLDYNDNKVYVLINDNDKIREINGGTTLTKNAGALMTGSVIINDQVTLCIIKV